MMDLDGARDESVGLIDDAVGKTHKGGCGGSYHVFRVIYE